MTCVQVCVSPGAWRMSPIQMTASSPTPQQQSRWRGRRVLAAALIPQPGAYPPKRAHLLLSAPHLSLRKTQTKTKKTQQQPGQKPPNAAQSKVATLLSSCVRQTNAGVTPGRRLHEPDSKLGRFAPRNRRLKHRQPPPGTGLRRHVRSLKGREQIPQ